MARGKTTRTIVDTAGNAYGLGGQIRAGQPNLPTLVRDQLLTEIRSGRWRPGDRLPTESELAARFGVSRTALREAIQSLHFLGIIDISPRRGSFVRALPVESVVDLAILSGLQAKDTPIVDVFEFRQALESPIAGMAAARASDPEVACLRSILDENAAAIARGDGAEARRIDVRFHNAIADASGNFVFRAIQTTLNGLFVELRLVTAGIPGASEAAYREHQEIFEALSRRDPAAARDAAERHVARALGRYNEVRNGLVTADLTMRFAPEMRSRDC